MPIKFKLRVILADAEMTQMELAKLSRVTPSTVSKLVTGSIREIPVTALERICTTLSCQPGDMLKYVPDGVPDGEPDVTGKKEG
jgi:putative transcriptional regulator